MNKTTEALKLALEKAQMLMQPIPDKEVTALEIAKAVSERALAIRAKKDGITQQINSISDQTRSIRIDRIPQFIPVGIVNDHHSITWMEEIVDDQAPIGAILYALQDSVGRNVSFAKEQK